MSRIRHGRGFEFRIAAEEFRLESHESILRKAAAER
jgi:hypothetical protein